MCFTPLERNIHWNVCLFTIFFLPMSDYFPHKRVAFLHEYVRVFIQNAK